MFVLFGDNFNKSWTKKIKREKTKREVKRRGSEWKRETNSFRFISLSLSFSHLSFSIKTKNLLVIEICRCKLIHLSKIKRPNLDGVARSFLIWWKKDENWKRNFRNIDNKNYQNCPKIIDLNINIITILKWKFINILTILKWKFFLSKMWCNYFWRRHRKKSGCSL